MQVRRPAPSVTAILGRLLLAIPLSLALTLGVHTAPAHAITRAQILARARHWIVKRVYYSQSSYYHGYRQDCSGFVSMAWRLKTSYTSATIHTRAHKISWRSLKPGDAVRRTGHVEIFGGWKSKKHRQYWALEESTWGKPALRRVKTFKHGYTALRRRGLQEKRRVLVAAVPTPPTAIAVSAITAAGLHPGPVIVVPFRGADLTTLVVP